ncbi:MAG: hypothetical protein WBR23_01495 [Candidatus Dormiibacterota bacterium]
MSMEVQAPPERQPSPAAAPAVGSPPAVARTEAGRPSRAAKASSRRGYRLGELILLSVAIVDAFLALDFVFRATAVSQDGFVSVVDRVGGALASPFAGLFRPGVPQVGHTTYWSALLAVAVYTVAALVLLRLLHLLSSPVRRRVGGA